MSEDKPKVIFNNNPTTPTIYSNMFEIIAHGPDQILAISLFYEQPVNLSVNGMQPGDKPHSDTPTTVERIRQGTVILSMPNARALYATLSNMFKNIDEEGDK